MHMKKQFLFLTITMAFLVYHGNATVSFGCYFFNNFFCKISTTIFKFEFFRNRNSSLTVFADGFFFMKTFEFAKLNYLLVTRRLRKF